MFEVKLLEVLSTLPAAKHSDCENTCRQMDAQVTYMHWPTNRSLPQIAWPSQPCPAVGLQLQLFAQAKGWAHLRDSKALAASAMETATSFQRRRKKQNCCDMISST